MLDARRVLGRVGEVISRGGDRGNAESRLDLPERSRHDEPGEQGDQPDNGQVMDRHANALRDPAPAECLDSRAHRSGEHEAKEHQRHDKPQLPDADADDGDAENDERGDGNAACSVREISAESVRLGVDSQRAPYVSRELRDPMGLRNWSTRGSSAQHSATRPDETRKTRGKSAMTHNRIRPFFFPSLRARSSVASASVGTVPSA